MRGGEVKEEDETDNYNVSSTAMLQNCTCGTRQLFLSCIRGGGGEGEQ